MSSSSLSELDSDAIKSPKAQGTPQQKSSSNKGAQKKAQRTRKSSRTPNPTQPAKKPSPGQGGPQPDSGEKPKKRSPAEAGLETSPQPRKAAARASPSKKPSPPRGGPQQNSRPSRTKTRPSRLVEEIEAKPAKPSKPAASAPAAAKGKKAEKWDADHVVHSSNSRLVRLTASQLKKVLLDTRTWACLSAEEKDELVAMLPEQSLPRLLEDNTEPDMLHEYLRYNEVFSDDVGRFLEQLEHGELDPGWQKKAAEAMEMRARGDFDEWKEREYEEYWGQKHEFVPITSGTGGGKVGESLKGKATEEAKAEKKVEREQGKKENGKEL
ncbi:MAG: hypothetical protein Q9157_004840 [Trypethelium eluteriae]